MEENKLIEEESGSVEPNSSPEPLPAERSIKVQLAKAKEEILRLEHMLTRLRTLYTLHFDYDLNKDRFSMTGKEFGEALKHIGIYQREFAILIGVSQRTICIWAGRERDPPNPVKAYLSLLMSLPSDKLRIELSRVFNLTSRNRKRVPEDADVER